MVLGTAGLLLASSPLGGIWFAEVLGLRSELVPLARLGLWISVPVITLTPWISWFQGRLLHARHWACGLAAGGPVQARAALEAFWRRVADAAQMSPLRRGPRAMRRDTRPMQPPSNDRSGSKDPQPHTEPDFLSSMREDLADWRQWLARAVVLAYAVAAGLASAEVHQRSVYLELYGAADPYTRTTSTGEGGDH